MNRRKLLKGVLGIGVASVAGPAIADQPDPNIHPTKGQSYKDLYEEQNTLIDSLELDRANLTRMSSTLQIHPQDHGGAYLELHSEPDGTLVLSNPMRGTEIRL